MEFSRVYKEKWRKYWTAPPFNGSLSLPFIFSLFLSFLLSPPPLLLLSLPLLFLPPSFLFPSFSFPLSFPLYSFLFPSPPGRISFSLIPGGVFFFDEGGWTNGREERRKLESGTWSPLGLKLLKLKGRLLSFPFLQVSQNELDRLYDP